MFDRRKAWLLVPSTIVIGLLSGTASAAPTQYRCLDNQLLRVRLDLAAHGKLDLKLRSHSQRRLPLESRLTCFRVSQDEGSA